MLSIKSYTELSLAALRTHDETCYRVWLIARSLYARGDGSVLLTDLKDFVKIHGLYSPQSLWRALQEGRGTWWRITAKRLWLHGLANMAKRLDVQLTQNPVSFPLDRLASIGDFRSALVASLFTRERTISYATLAAMTGRDRRTVIRWCKRAGLTVVKNDMLSNRPSGGLVAPELASQGYRHTLVGRSWRLVRRLPNTYQAPADFERAPYGLVKRIKKVMRQQPPFKNRCYFTKPNGLHRALGRLEEEQEIYTPLGLTSRDGTRLWQGYQGVNGSFVVC